MARLDGKRAVVTGGASGLGFAIAERFASEGARVVIADLDEQRLTEAAEELGDAVVGLACDVADPGQVHELAERAVAELGGVDCYHNNAGVAHPVTALAELTQETWDRAIAVNLTAIFIAAREVAPVMEQQDGGGVFLITSSISGRRPRPGLAAYTASKGGAIALTNALAVELAPSIRVNGIAPLAVATPMFREFAFGDAGESDEDTQGRLASVVPLQRLTQPGDVAAAAVYLASDEASAVTGVTLNVDCGRHL